MSNIDELLVEISKLKTPADEFFYNLQTNYYQILFPGKFIKEEEIPDEKKTEYFHFTRGIFYNLTFEKLKFFRKLFNKFFIDFNSSIYTLEGFKNDKVEVFVFDTFVVRFYKCDFLNRKRDIFEIQNNHPNLENILEAKYCDELDFGYIVSEKLLPLVNNKLKINPVYINSYNLDYLKRDITDALNFLHENGIRHKDARLDNIGLRPSECKFVLFDFEGSDFESNTELFKDDFKDFDGSIRFHKLE